MALLYSGATAGTTLSNPPVLLAAGMGGHVQYASSGSTTPITALPTGANGAKLWFYSSTNLFTDVCPVLNVFGDGVALGMNRGDVLIGVYSSADSTAPVLYMGVLTCSAGSTGMTISSLGAFSSTMATGA